MACNTAHFFADDVQKKSKLPILDMCQLTADHVLIGMMAQGKKGALKVGLLSTDAVVETRVYHSAFEKASLEMLGDKDAIQVVCPSGKDISTV